MPQGLQVFDASGNIIMDISDRVGRVLGILRIPAGASSSLTLSGYTNGQVFAAFQRDNSFVLDESGQQLGSVPNITVSGGTITWVSSSQFTTWLGNSVFVRPVGGWLTYGVY